MDKGSSPLKLHTPLKFWYQHYIKGEGNFEDSLLPVGTVNTVEQLWAFYQHFKKPSQLEDGSYIYLFQNNIKPVWEDQSNKKGGSFVLRFQRSKSNRLWQDLLLSFAVSPKNQVSDISGMRIKIRKDNAEIDFWISNSTPATLQKCRQWILKRTDLDTSLPLEFIQFFKEQ